MKNKLSYLIGVACLLSYTGTFTSCVNGVDDEYLEQKLTEVTGGEEGEGEELPDLNGDYSIEGDYDLVMTCNGEVLDGKKVIMTVDEGNETASITFAAAQTDLETVIATVIPGGAGGLVSGWGLKYTGSSPIPGEKEVTVTDVPLFRNGTSYMFKGGNIQPTYTMTFDGKIEDEKLTINIDYELVNQKLAGTWKVADALVTKDENGSGIKAGESYKLSPLWVDWDSKVEVTAGKIPIMPGFSREIITYPNDLVKTVVQASKIFLGDMLGAQVTLEELIVNMLNSVTAKPNGGMYAIYSYSGDFSNPLWSGVDGMPHNAMRYFYDPEKPDERIYLELNSAFLINLIESLASPAAPTSRSTTRADLRDIAKELIKLLVPLVEYGIPCEYKLEGDRLTLNIDGIVLRDILAKLMVVLNDPAVKDMLNGAIAGLGDLQDNVTKLLSTLPEALVYQNYDRTTGVGTGECGPVKLGLKFVKQ